jgi:aminoglycoside phosphotransferase (APT) family kinase protein
VTPDVVASYLAAREGRPVRIDRVARAAGGLSRETWFVRGPDISLVFRCDLRGGFSSCPVPLTFEYDMHRRLPQAGLPVTRALWFEHDESVLGRRFYVRECVDGSSTIPGFADPGPAGDELRIEVSREHVRQMAKVHLTDWRALALDELMPAPAAPADCAATTVARLKALHDELQLSSSPLLALAFDWFAQHAPRTAPAVALCKGSNGAMQEVWRDGRIVALCDWELASLGDPTNDWARCQGYLPTVPGRWSERAALDYYESLTGYHISESALAYYRALYWLEMTLVGLYAKRALQSGALLDARLAFLSTYAVHTAEIRLMNTLATR